MIFESNATEHNQFVLEQAHKVLGLLKNNLFDAVICGGLCRDIVLDTYAKDADIIVYNWHPGDVAEDTLKNSFECALQEISPFFQRCEAYGVDSNDFELRQIREVIKAKVEGVEIDIIFIEDCHPEPIGMYARFNKGMRRCTLQSVLWDFDCPVNMFYYSEVYKKVLHVDASYAEYAEHAAALVRNFCSCFICKLNLGDERLVKNYMRLKMFEKMGDKLLPYFYATETNSDKEQIE